MRIWCLWPPTFLLWYCWSRFSNSTSRARKGNDIPGEDHVSLVPFKGAMIIDGDSGLCSFQACDCRIPASVGKYHRVRFWVSLVLRLLLHLPYTSAPVAKRIVDRSRNQCSYLNYRKSLRFFARKIASLSNAAHDLQVSLFRIEGASMAPSPFADLAVYIHNGGSTFCFTAES